VASALEKLRRHPEPEVAFMRRNQGFIPAYDVQAGVDAEHALIVAQPRVLFQTVLLLSSEEPFQGLAKFATDGEQDFRANFSLTVLDT
jgi:hypothetical protein